MRRLVYYVLARLLASWYIAGALLLLIVTGTYLSVRIWLDRRIERKWNIDTLREGAPYLGAWANISPSALIVFRLRKDGGFTFQIRETASGDTGVIEGRYDWIPLISSYDVNYYPRIIARDAKGDTIFNYFVAYITPHGSTVDQIDHMELKTNGRFDTTGYTFFRLKQ